jgi:cupin 2 domain-containing protein
MSNLLADLPRGVVPEEIVSQLLCAAHIRIERIVSTGHASPPGFWYDQDEGEWLVVLTGAARLRIEGDSEPRSLAPGDFLDLPAHTRHRVEWTDPTVPTVWLAVFYR